MVRLQPQHCWQMHLILQTSVHSRGPVGSATRVSTQHLATSDSLGCFLPHLDALCKDFFFCFHVLVDAGDDAPSRNVKQVNDTFHSHAENNINSLNILSLKSLHKKARASFRPSETIHKHKGTFETRHSKTGTRYTTIKLRGRITGPRSPRPATLPSHLFPLTTTLLSQPVHSERKVRRDSRPLGGITRPSLVHFLAKHVPGNSRSPLPTPNPAGKEGSCHQAHTMQRIVAHVVFSRATGRHTFVFRPNFAFTLPHWTLWAAHFPFVPETRGHDLHLLRLFLLPLLSAGRQARTS